MPTFCVFVCITDHEQMNVKHTAPPHMSYKHKERKQRKLTIRLFYVSMLSSRRIVISHLNFNE